MLQGCVVPFSWGCLGTLRNRRMKDPVSLASDLSGVMEHIHIEVRASGVITWLVAPFPFGTFPRAQDSRILVRGDCQAWCLTRMCLTKGWQECCLGLSPWVCRLGLRKDRQRGNTNPLSIGWQRPTNVPRQAEVVSHPHFFVDARERQSSMQL